jgi:hypothetical protein
MKENPEATPSIENLNGSYRVYLPHIELDAKKDPYQLLLTIRKSVTPIEDGTVIESVTIDNQSPKLTKARQEAGHLKLLPERQRIHPLMAILDRNLQYAFPWVMDEVAQTDPNKAAWVEKNTGINTSNSQLTLSQVFDAGYGVCRYLSVALLALGKDAGLEGAHLTYHPRDDDKSGNIANIIRKDNGRPLFRSVGVGETFDVAHTWVEFKMSDGTWIPIDPTPKLIGDTPQGLETFREANYTTDLNLVIQAEGLPNDVYGLPSPSLQFRVAEAERTGNFNIFALRKYIVTSPKKIDDELFQTGSTELIYTHYKGPLDFVIKSQKTYKGTVVEILDVKPKQKSHAYS